MFRLEKMGVGLTPPIEYLPVTAGEIIVLGEALAVEAGALTKCGATEKPAYICVGVQNNAGELPVVKVEDYMTFETTLSTAPGDGVTLKMGDKLTLHTDGAQVTATTASGVAEVVTIDGQTAGSAVTVRF